MDIIFQRILLGASISYFIFTLYMVRKRKLQLRYSLVWSIISSSFIFLAVFPGVLKLISKIIKIKEPVNALFLVIIFFLIVIIFTLNLSLVTASEKLKTLVQEFGLLKLEIEKMKKGDSLKDGE